MSAFGTTSQPITVTPRGDDTYVEIGTDVTWVRDAYTEPRETIYDCEGCGKPIEDWELWTCMDGGEAAHIGCVEVVSNDPG